MASLPAKEMLSKLLKAGTLTAKDRETFEGMWDAVHRYGGLSKRQMAWIEDVYYKQKFDEPNRAAPKRSSKIGFIEDPGAQSVKRAISMANFQIRFPEYKRGTPIYRRVEAFFRAGGEVFEVRPKKDEGSSSSTPPASSKA